MNYDKTYVEDLRERSKDDRKSKMIVGSEIRVLCSMIDDLHRALKALYDETADYIRINNLGDVHHSQSMKDARSVLYGEVKE